MQPKRAAEPERLALHFDENRNQHDSPIREGMSSFTRHGRYLWVGFDESTTVERLQRLPSGSYGAHRQFRLADYVDLPGDDDVEMDIEGLDVCGGYLYVSGSMSEKRDTPDADDKPKKQAAALKRVSRDANRYNFIRLPLGEDDKGHPVPARKLRRGGETLLARCFRTDGKSNLLLEGLKDDAHLRNFIPIPSKDNGFDAEGLAVFGERVFFGLRGPVLGGYAVVLELQLRTKGKRTLRPRKIGRHEQRYRKHFLNLAGMGIRELYADEATGDLYILAGPTMDLDGTIALWRIAGGLPDAKTSVAVEVERLYDVTRPADVPYGHDKAEALTRMADGRFLVGYDSPVEDRLIDADSVYADLYPDPEDAAG